MVSINRDIYIYIYIYRMSYRFDDYALLTAVANFMLLLITGLSYVKFVKGSV